MADIEHRSTFAALKPDEVAPCLARQGLDLRALIGSPPYRTSEIGDGNLNFVFRTESAEGGSVITKQSVPYVRMVGEGWRLSPDRNLLETRAYEVFSGLVPDLVPRLYHADPESYLFVMEDLRPRRVLREAMVEGALARHAARDLGRFVGEVFFATSVWGQAQEERRRAAARFANPELCKITEDLVLTDPLDPGAPLNRHNPRIDADAAELQHDQSLRRRLSELRYTFMTRADGLVHGDLHIGSVMVGEADTKAIDPEFAFYGPVAFDLGAVVSNYLLNACAHEVRTRAARARARLQAARLEDVGVVWQTFAGVVRSRFPARLDRRVPPEQLEAVLERLAREVAGFAAAKMMRRILGLAHVSDFEGIADLDARAHAERFALRVARGLLTADSGRPEDWLRVFEAAQSGLATRP